MRAGAGETGRNTSAETDRVLPETRVLAAVIVPFLLLAVAALMGFPDRTADLFAWTIKPRMTPMVLGAVYLGGAYFFVRAATLAQWHRIKVGFLPVTTFATVMGVATILHWDRFHHDHVAFVLWALLYFTTPFLVLAVWLRNRGVGPSLLDPHEFVVSQPVRAAMAVSGLVILLATALLFVVPDLLITIWPWQLTPLTARVMCAMFALVGVGDLTVACDPRWSVIRIALEAQTIAIAANVVALLFSWTDLNPANPLTWAYAAGAGGLLLAIPLLYVWIERGRGSGRALAATPPGQRRTRP